MQYWCKEYEHGCGYGSYWGDGNGYGRGDGYGFDDGGYGYDYGDGFGPGLNPAMLVTGVTIEEIALNITINHERKQRVKAKTKNRALRNVWHSGAAGYGRT